MNGKWKSGIKKLLKYLVNSFSTALIELAVFTLCNLVLFSSLSLDKNVFFSTLVSRGIASVYNFLFNRKVVFRSKEKKVWVQVLEYYALVACQMLCSAGLVYLFTKLLGWNATVVKAIVDTALFFVTFQVQNKLIFRR